MLYLLAVTAAPILVYCLQLTIIVFKRIPILNSCIVFF